MDATEATIDSAPHRAQEVHAPTEPPLKAQAERSEPPAASDETATQATSAEASASARDAEVESESEAEAESVEGSAAAHDELTDAEPAETSASSRDGDLVGKPDRRKLEEQLEALKRKEFELRRALTIADHPDLADAIRALEGRAYAIERVEAKLAQGLSKAEERRRETIEKKLGALREKRSELDAQIDALELEQRALGAERAQAFEAERRHALEQLLVTLGTHEPAFRAALLEPTELVPELTRFLPEIQALAETLVAARDAR